MRTEICSRTQTVVIAADSAFIAIGERINPSGRSKLGMQMAAGDFSIVRRDAQTQVAAGAQVLDVNAGYALGDEAVMLPAAIAAVRDVTDVPLCFDSTSSQALEAALAIYPGKALVNSVTGEEHSLETLLPLVRKHRCAVIGLVLDDTGISKHPRERLAIARKIVQRARDYGIPAEDVILDPLCMTIAADPRAALVTFETIRLIRDELGVNQCCGAGNVSFGLPDRAALASAFLPVAISCGLTAAITDVTQPAIREALLAADLLFARDDHAARWLAHFRKKEKAAHEAPDHLPTARPDHVHA